MTTTRTPERARHPVRDEAHAVGAWRGAWLRVEGLWTWYRRYWTSNLYSSGLQPLLYLLAMGVGFGSQVQRAALPYDVTYVQYVAPALLVAGAVQFGVGESTYPVLSGFKWEKSYLAITATPVTAGQVVGGHLIWVGLRVTLAAVVYAVVAAFFGAWTGAGVLAAAVVGIGTGLACAAPITAFTATTDDDQRLAALFRFGVIPMVLFAGTFFPVEQIPGALRWLAWISPLWHGNELARGVTLGGLDLLPALGHAAVLVALFVVGGVLARHFFYRRLVR
ncbi:ABC transporter permease [Saccharomonospora piscinae]|uniref:ABC transporter permease n=1 Tax=Saccharomonospora piscinae TaxID=687388 RepID=UPI0004661562|nr:ABC transporter permease [Saccharomonospora piscinae]